MLNRFRSRKIFNDSNRQITEQWGNVIASQRLQIIDVTLPIAVNRILVAVCSSYSGIVGNEGNSGQVSDFQKDSLKIVIDNGAGVWVSICI